MAETTPERKDTEAKVDSSESKSTKKRVAFDPDQIPDVQKVTELVEKEKEPKVKKTHSVFADLRARLDCAATISTFAIRNRSKPFLTEFHQFQLFLQAISNRSVGLYEEFFAEYRLAVVVLLERMMEWPQTAKWSAFAHEFCLRAEANGARHETYLEGVEFDDDVAEPLISTADMLTTLASRDPVGRASRMVELCRSFKDIRKCSKALTEDTLIAKASMKAHGQLFNRLLSKVRQLCGLTKERADDDGGAVHLDQKTLDRLLADIHAVVDVKHLPTPAKLVSFLSWAKTNEGLDVDVGASGGGDPEEGAEQPAAACSSSSVASKLLQSAEDSTNAMAQGMAAVLTLKSAEDLAAVVEAVSDLVDSATKRLKINTQDVLSVLATTAQTWKEKDAEAASSLCQKVFKLLKAEQASGASLPRRSLRFVQEQQRAEQSAAGLVAARKRPREEEDDDPRSNIE